MVMNLSTLRASRPLPLRNIPGTNFSYRLSLPEGHFAAGKIRSIEIPNNLIENRTRDLPACNIVPEVTALKRAPVNPHNVGKIGNNISIRHRCGTYPLLADYR
jgi:hypothetical protein